jgi:hypothetical protein
MPVKPIFLKTVTLNDLRSIYELCPLDYSKIKEVRVTIFREEEYLEGDFGDMCENKENICKTIEFLVELYTKKINNFLFDELEICLIQNGDVCYRKFSAYKRQNNNDWDVYRCGC